jgi:hypothetical protein
MNGEGPGDMTLKVLTKHFLVMALLAAGAIGGAGYGAFNTLHTPRAITTGRGGVSQWRSGDVGRDTARLSTNHSAMAPRW